MDLRTVNSRACFGAVMACAVTACGSTAPSAPGPAQAGASAPPGIAYEAHIAAGGKAPAGGVLNAPQGHGPELAKAGETLFAAMNCDGCHGGAGAGWIAPSLADGRWRYGGSDQEIFTSIYYGRPKGMPAFGGVLDPDGVWNLVAYLKSIPLPPNEPTESWE